MKKYIHSLQQGIRIPTLLVLLFILPVFTLAQSPVPEDATLELVESGFELAEGPYWHPDGYLLFSDVWSSIIYKWSEDSGMTPFLNPSGEANGISADLDGNMLICQHKEKQVGRIEANGTVTPLASQYDGKQFHSPNDLAVKSDGAVFFTDPPWGGTTVGLNFHGVYRIPPGGGDAQLLVDSLSYPNGIAFSPDESKLYLSHNGDNTILVYDVIDDSTLANGVVFATLPGSSGGDGMKVDAQGNIYATCADGVAIFSEDGELLDTIEVSRSTNVNFGGENGYTLFITTFPTVYKIDLIDPTVSIGEKKSPILNDFQLNQNYPNPFNPKTVISYKLKVKSEVELSLFNLLGQKVATLVNKKQPEGEYSITFDASGLTSGIYIYKLKTGSFEQSKKMILLQ